MAFAKINKPSLRLPAAPTGYKAFKLWTQAALRRVAAASGNSLQIDGAEAATVGSDGGMQFKIASGGSGAACVYNWQPTFVRNDEDGHDIVTLEPGSVAGVTVTVDGTSILDFPRPELSIPDTADTTQIVYLELGGITETLGDGDFVIGCSIGTATIEVGTSLPSDTISTTSTIYKELFRWRNGALQSQLNKYNFNINARGPSGSATFTWLYAA